MITLPSPASSWCPMRKIEIYTKPQGSGRTHGDAIALHVKKAMYLLCASARYRRNVRQRRYHRKNKLNRFDFRVKRTLRAKLPIRETLDKITAAFLLHRGTAVYRIYTCFIYVNGRDCWRRYIYHAKTKFCNKPCC